jgi:PAS domain S-box-containing protein
MPSAATVLTLFEQEWPTGTPVTTAEVAAEFDCSTDTIHDKLTSLAADGSIQKKEVGDDSHVWWQPDASEATRRDQSPNGQSELRSQPVFDSNLVGVIVWGDDGTITDANDAFLDMAGLSYEEALGSSRTDLTPDPSDLASQRADSSTEHTSSGVHAEQEYDTDGSRWWGLSESRQLPDGSKIEYVIDITERRRRERRFQALVEESNDIIMVVDSEGSYTYQSPSVERILGYDPAEVVGETAIERVHPEDREKIKETFQELEPNSVTEGTIEYRIRDADGSWRWMEATGNQQFDNPAVEGFVINSREVTERKAREQELTAAKDEITRLNNLHETILSNIRDTVVATDETGNFTYICPNVEFVFGYDSDEVAEMGTIEALLDGRPAEPAVLEEQGEITNVEQTITDKDGTERTVLATVRKADIESGTRLYSVREITQRKEHERELEKRQRVLKELHDATRDFHPPKSEDDIAAFVVSFLRDAFDFEHLSVKQWDDSEGALKPVDEPGATGPASEIFGTVTPGSNPIWGCFRTEETQILEREVIRELLEPADSDYNQLVAVPIGDFGVAVVLTTGEQTVDNVDIDLIEVVAANAESGYKRLRSEQSQADLTAELATQQERVADLQSVIDAVQAIQQRIADSESREALETGVCQELLGTDQIDFAWVGRPKGGDTELEPAAWAGNGESYLLGDAAGNPSLLVPAQRAAAKRGPFAVSRIPNRVVDEEWAKDALSAGFQSVIAVPLIYDNVLYGVLTAYSEAENAFGTMYERLLEDVASLLVNYSQIIDQRFTDADQEQTELEFELRDERYPLQRLATAADATIRYLTVAEKSSDAVRCLVAVKDASVQAVCAEAAGIADIVEAEPFGDSDTDQLSVTVTGPFLPQVVAKHGGTVVDAVSDTEQTRLLVQVPASSTTRPLLEALTSRYDDVTLLAKRQTTTTRDALPALEDVLTERQIEILTAAYHGGYYESPRGVTGEELADSFDISSPAIYNHLQAAHRALIEPLLGTTSDSQI